MRKIVVSEKGIFWQSQVPVSVREIEKRRIWLTKQIQDTKAEQQQLTNKIEAFQIELQSISTSVIDNYVITVKKQQAEAMNKAEKLLEECLGPANYAILKEKKSLKFKAQDGVTYKITARGVVLRKDNKEWKRLCLIRPQSLPLPDFVLAALINVREHPQKYRR